MNLKKVNFATLQDRYFSNGSAQEGAKLIDMLLSSKKSHGLSYLLRSHLIKGVGGRETEKRDRIDDLIAFYSILELASLLKVIPSKLPKNLTKRAIKHLSNFSVRRYYERFYPLVLPQLFLRRLTGQPLITDCPSNSFSYFDHFMILSDILKDDGVDLFLWFLDEGETDSYGIDDFFEVISNSSRFARRLTRTPNKQTALDKSLHGFLKFLYFCREMDAFLVGLSDYPVIQSAFWHYHGYWFQQLSGQVLGVLSVAIEQYREWIPPKNSILSQEDIETIEDSHRVMDRAFVQVRRLTSAIYRIPLEETLFASDSEEEEARVYDDNGVVISRDLVPQSDKEIEATIESRTSQGISLPLLTNEATGSAISEILKSILSSALGNEAMEVRKWVKHLLISRNGVLAGGQHIDLHLIPNIKDMDTPLILSTRDAMALGNMGTKQNISALIEIMINILLMEDKYGERQKEVTSFMVVLSVCFGLYAADMSSDQVLMSWELIEKTKARLTNDETLKPINWALGEIQNRIKIPVVMIMNVSALLGSLSLIASLPPLVRGTAASSDNEKLNIRRRLTYQTENGEYILNLLQFASGTIRLKISGSACVYIKEMRISFFLKSEERTVLEFELNKREEDSFRVSIKDPRFDISQIKAFKVITP
jgi:hypothetical protein